MSVHPRSKEKAIEKFVRAIRSCGDSRDAAAAKRIHSIIQQQNPELERDRYLANLLVQMYGKCGCIEEAFLVFESTSCKNMYSYTIMMTALIQNGHLHQGKSVFDTAPQRDIVSWNSMVDSHAQANLFHESKDFFTRMPQWDALTWTSLITANAQHGNLDEAKTMFDACKERDVVSWTAMLSAFSSNNCVVEAKDLFDSMPRRNVVSWNAIVAAFARCGDLHLSGTRKLFVRMPYWDIVTCTSVLDAFASAGELGLAKEVFDMMPVTNVVSCTTMLLAYARAGCLESAEQIFGGVLKPKKDDVVVAEDDVVVWTAMLVAYSENGLLDKARAVFERMPERNHLSWNALLQAYSENNHLPNSRAIFNLMPKHDVASWNTICGAYAVNGNRESFEDCRRTFNQMPERNLLSWNGMLVAYSKLTVVDQAEQVFDKCPKHDVISLTVLIVALGHNGHVEGAERVFESMADQLDTVSWNAMIVVYVGGGHLAKARGLFVRIRSKTAATWNAMISAHAQNGHADVALEFLRGMCLAGVIPGAESFRCVLAACSYSGMMRQAWENFVMIRGDHGIEPSKDHYCCMVDVLGRAGRLSCAEELIDAMPYLPTDVEWGSLLGACAIYKDVHRAERAANVLFDLMPLVSAPYVTLANVYTQAGRHRQATALKRLMQDKGVRSEIDMKPAKRSSNIC